MDRRQGIHGILAGGRQIPPNLGKALRPCRGAEAARDLLFDLDHPHIALGQVVVKRDPEVVQEGQGLGLEVPEPIQQVQRRGLRRASALFAAGAHRRRRGPRIDAIPRFERLLIAPVKGRPGVRRQGGLPVRPGGVDCGFDLDQEFRQRLGPRLAVLLVDELQFPQVVGIAQGMGAVGVGKIGFPVIVPTFRTP